jgi:hypothetical protein
VVSSKSLSHLEGKAFSQAVRRQPDLPTPCEIRRAC